MLQLHYFVENLINIAIKIDEYKYVKTSIDEMIYKHTIYINPSHVIKITPSSIRRGGGVGAAEYIVKYLFQKNLMIFLLK